MVMNPQQPSQPRGGLLGLFDKAMKPDEDTGLSPLQNFAAALDPLILKDLRGGEGIRQQGVQRAASMSKNKTVDMLRKQGRDDLANALLNRTIGTKEAFGIMQSDKAADLAFQLFTELGDKKSQALVLHGQAALKIRGQAFEQGLNLSKAALSLFRELGMKKLEGFEMQCIANWHLMEEKAEDAVVWAEKANDLFQSIKYSKGQVASLETLVQANLASGDPLAASDGRKGGGVALGRGRIIKFCKTYQNIYEIYTKYIQFIENCCLKEAKLSNIPFGGRFAAPNACIG